MPQDHERDMVGRPTGADLRAWRQRFDAERALLASMTPQERQYHHIARCLKDGCDGKPVVTLYEYPDDWSALLIPRPSGVVFEQQTCGVMCHQDMLEGVLIPLPPTQTPPGRAGRSAAEQTATSPRAAASAGASRAAAALGLEPSPVPRDARDLAALVRDALPALADAYDWEVLVEALAAAERARHVPALHPTLAQELMALHVGCCTSGITAEEADAVDAVLSQHVLPLRVDQARLADSTEAWIWVQVDERPMTCTWTLYAFRGESGVLTFANCD